MKKHLLAAVVMATGFALFLPSVFASADDLTLVTVDCGDGSPLQATVDTTTLTSLEASVQAITENPAGLSCTLSTSPLPSLTGPTLGTSASAASSQPFVVGGGRYGRTDGCGVNFNISAHLDSNNVAHGTMAFAINNASGCAQGNEKASVTCLSVPVSTTAEEVRGDIYQATGSLALSETTPPTVLVTDVTDNGTPSTGTPDTIFQTTDSAGTEMACTTTPGVFGLDNGNITVHD